MTPEAEAGREPFAANCGFCHGRDAGGGSSGPDLTHAELVLADQDGSRIAELLRSGRADKGMPAFAALTAKDVSSIIAFINYQKALADSENGQRRSVDASDLLVGDAKKGQRYFDRNCTGCHSPTGDMAGIGKRYNGLPLLRRMLYPGSESRNNPPKPATVEVTTRKGERIRGALAYRDEFVIALRESDGRYRSWSTATVTYTLNDPMDAHFQQLGKYTDADMHDVYAYLQGLQ